MRKTACDCKAWAQVMKKRYLEPEDWFRARFSDKVRFGYGPQGKLRIIRKPGEGHCPDCIQEDKEPKKKDKKKASTVGLRWATISNLIMCFDEVPARKITNRKMSQRVHIDQNS